ncbi:MAG: hypothetical protein WA183_04640 [Chthoniobacterales bacterium]
MRLILTFLIAFVSVCRAEETASGHWEGSVQIPGRELTLIVDLAQDSRGGWIGSITIPGLNAKGSPLADIVVSGIEVSFAIKGSSAQALQATFKAKLNIEGTLSGDFEQAGNTAPFTLKRMAAAQVELPPKSTAIGKELEGEWKGEFELFGSPRKVALKLANRGTDASAAEFVVVGKKTTTLPVDLVTQEGDLLTIDSHETSISYEGRFRKDAGEIKGTFTAGGIELPLVLRRAK